MFSAAGTVLRSARNFSFFRATTPTISAMCTPAIPKAAFISALAASSNEAMLGIALSVGLIQFLAFGCRHLGYAESTETQISAAATVFHAALKIYHYLIAEEQLSNSVAEAYEAIGHETPNRPRHARGRLGIMG